MMAERRSTPFGMSMHQLRDELNVFDRRLWQYAVPQVENMALATGDLLQYRADLPLDLGTRREQKDWIEVPLHGAFVPDPFPGSDRDQPASRRPQHRRRSMRSRFENAGGAGAEHDHGRAIERAHLRHDACVNGRRSAR